MTGRIPPLLVLLLAATVSRAQTVPADEYFNRAARQYVKEDKAAALRTLDKGLQAHPGDARMLKLAEELLKEQQQQQQAGQRNEQKEQEQRQEQQQAGQQRNEGKDGERKPPPDRMDRQSAERILDALERQEQGTQEKVRARMRPVQRRRIEKDW